MKTLFLFIILLAMASPVCAEDSERIRHLEGEINALKQATTDQGERIQSLESRVGSREATFSQEKSSNSWTDSQTDDGQVPDNSNRKQDDSNHQYTD